MSLQCNHEKTDTHLLLDAKASCDEGNNSIVFCMRRYQSVYVGKVILSSNKKTWTFHTVNLLTNPFWYEMFIYRVLNKLKIFYEAINKNEISLGSKVTCKQQQKKTDVLRQIKDENVTISPQIHKMLHWHVLFAI